MVESQFFVISVKSRANLKSIEGLKKLSEKELTEASHSGPLVHDFNAVGKNCPELETPKVANWVKSSKCFAISIMHRSSSMR